jgi:hypothetical protein
VVTHFLPHLNRDAVYRILKEGFNQAYNRRRQRVLKGRSPDEVVRSRLAA